MYIRDCEQREPQAMVQAAHRVWCDGYEAFVAFGLEDKIVRRIHWKLDVMEQMLAEMGIDPDIAMQEGVLEAI